MILVKKILLLFWIAIVLFITCPIEGFAFEIGGVPVLYEIDLPKNLNFSVSDTCSEHVYFLQASADEEGNFAVYSRQIGMDDYLEVNLERVYIDLYRSDGTFSQELSFTIPLDLAVELTEESVNLFFYASVLVYDVETQELRHYTIPEGAAVNGGIYKELRQTEFVCGNWKYTCKKAFDGYTQLIRRNNSLTQVLVQMPGTRNSFWTVVFPGVAIGVIGIAIIVWLYTRRNKTRDNALS